MLFGKIKTNGGTTMAFKDLLKKATDAANNLAAKGAQMAQQAKENLENERQARAEAEAVRKAEEAARLEAEEAAKKEMRDRILNGDPDDERDEYYRTATREEKDELDALEEAAEEKRCNDFLETLTNTTACDLGKGDCCWNSDRFYCTCGDDVDCPRKKYVKAKQFGKLHSPAHFPYIKYLSKIEKKPLYEDRFYYSCDGDGNYDHLLKVFFEKCLPTQYSSYRLSESICKEDIYKHGLGEDNPVMSILYYLQDASVENSASLSHLFFIMRKGEIDLSQPIFKNVSIYQRSENDIDYTMKILDIVNNPEKLEYYYPNHDHIDISQLYNADGSVKEAGVGGPKKGFYGDVIYNIVASWDTNEEE